MFRTYGTGSELTSDTFTGSVKYRTLENVTEGDYAHYVDIGRPLRNLYENEYEMYLQFQNLIKSTITYNYGVIRNATYGSDFVVTSTDAFSVTVKTGPSATETQYYLRMPTGLALTQDGTFFVNKPRLDVLERQLFKVLQMYDLDNEYVKIKYDTVSKKFKAKINKIYLARGISVAETVKTMYFGCAASTESDFTNETYSSGYLSAVELLVAINNWVDSFFTFYTFFQDAIGVSQDFSKLICEPVIKTSSTGTYYWKIGASGTTTIDTVAPTTNEIGLYSASMASLGVLTSITDIRKFFSFKTIDSPLQSNVVLYSDFDYISGTSIKSNYTNTSFTNLEFVVDVGSNIESGAGFNKNGVRVKSLIAAGIYADTYNGGALNLTPVSGINISFYLNRETSTSTSDLVKVVDTGGTNIFTFNVNNSTGAIAVTQTGTSSYWIDGESMPVSVTTGSWGASKLLSFNIYTTTRIGKITLMSNCVGTVDSVYVFKVPLTDKNISAIQSQASIAGASYNKNIHLIDSFLVEGNTTLGLDTNSTVTITGGSITTAKVSASVFDSGATTATAFNAATTSMTLGGTAGNAYIRNPTTTFGDSGTTTTVLAVPASVTTATLFNTISTTVNFAGAATTLTMGAITGNAYIRNPTTTFGDSGTTTTTLAVPASVTTATLFNTISTTVNFAGAATTLAIGAATGTATINNATLSIPNATAVTGVKVSSLDLGSTVTTAATYNIGTGATAGSTTKIVNIGTAGISTSVTDVNIGSAVSGALGTTTINSVTLSAPNATSVSGVNTTTLDLGSSITGTATYNIGTGATAGTTTKTINIGTAGVSTSITNVNIGSAVSGATGTTTINSTTLSIPNAASITIPSVTSVTVGADNSTGRTATIHATTTFGSSSNNKNVTVYGKVSSKSTNVTIVPESGTPTVTIGTGAGITILSGAGTLTATLPAISSTAYGDVYSIKYIGTGTCSISRASSDLIDGQTSISLLQYECLVLVSTSAGVWSII